MAPKICAFCESELSPHNNHKEHVIPNALGGRKRIRGFICSDCNHKYGAEWDSELARQFSTVCLYLLIKRDRKSVRSQTFLHVTGDEIIVHPDGYITYARPKHTQTRNPLDNKVKRICISGLHKGNVQTHIRSLSQKYPGLKIDVEEEYQDATWSDILNLGGLMAGRSIVKSVMALAVEHGVDPRKCDLAKRYLMGDGDPCFGYFYDKTRDLVKHRPLGIPFHCVFVRGIPSSRKLIGYVEIFGVLRTIVVLDDRYEGHEFSGLYAINPMTGRNIELSVDLTLSTEDVEAAYCYEKFDMEVYAAAVENVMAASHGRLFAVVFERAQGTVVEQAVQRAVENWRYEDVERTIGEHLEEFLRLCMETIEPFVDRNFDRYSRDGAMSRLCNKVQELAQPHIEKMLITCSKKGRCAWCEQPELHGNQLENFIVSPTPSDSVLIFTCKRCGWSHHRQVV